MTRYGRMFGPDITFLGVDRCGLSEPESYEDADIVILGAPFDGGTSNRTSARFGPEADREGLSARPCLSCS
jgi:agmatinase